MQADEVYSAFDDEIRWIQDRLNEQLDLLSPDLRRRAEHYLKRRLRILPDRRNRIFFDPALGKPVPYATFWFADAMHVKEKDATKSLALGLLYVSLYTTINDDILDHGRSDAVLDSVLANFYFDSYITIFQDLFPMESAFWRYLREGRIEATRYELWRDDARGTSFQAPLSEGFLKESSRYFIAVVLPTLAAVALLADKEEKIPEMRRFLYHFSMGWRVFDDLSDWEKDLSMEDQNHSSVLGYISQRNGGGTAARDIVLSSFLSTGFIRKVYRVMLGFLEAAKDDAMVFQSPHLERFMEEQLRFHESRRDEILRTGRLMRSSLKRIVLRTIS